MVKLWRTYLVLVIAFLAVQSALGQHVRSQISVNKSQVYLGEPVQVTVGIFSTTWFTEGVVLPNIQVEDAFTVYFRSLSTSKQIDGKTYAGVEFFFNVYPYTENDITFPAMTVDVVTPDEGDYKGVNRQVKTRAVKVKVRPIPDGFESADWLVTGQLTVTENWQGDLSSVKVGDVLTRSIYRKAARTVAELIPPISWDTISGVSLYPQRAESNNHKTKTDFYADRTDRTRYLFEKEGTVTIPEKTLMWWNPVQKKVYKRTLKARTIEVLPNPDLGMLESIKDSLAAMQAEAKAETPEDKPFSFLGMNWKQLTVAVALTAVGGKYLWKLIAFLVAAYRRRRKAYLGSEKYYFNLFLAALNKPSEAEKALYRWLDCLHLDEYTRTYFESNFGESAATSNGLSNSVVYWKNARNKYLKSQARTVEVRRGWVNP